MGYWQTNDKGESFAPVEDSDSEMLWGDAPADAMEEALSEIIATFRRDTGRAPTLAELKAGLLFSAQGSLEADEKRRIESQLYTYEVVEHWTWDSTDGDLPTECLDSSFYDANSTEDARAQYEADLVQSAATYNQAGITRELVSIEQIEETRTHKARGKLTVVQGEGSDE